MLGPEGRCGDLATACNTSLAKEVGVKPGFLGSQLCTSPPVPDFLEGRLLLFLKILHLLGYFWVWGFFFFGGEGDCGFALKPSPQGLMAAPHTEVSDRSYEGRTQHRLTTAQQRP